MRDQDDPTPVHSDHAPPREPWHRRVGQVRLAAVSAALLFALSLAFAPVRGAASDFLKVFRARDIKAISMTPEEMAQIASAFEGSGDTFDLGSLGKVTIEGEAVAEEVSLAEAQAAVDFDVVVPDGLDATPTVTLQHAQVLRFTLDVDAVNEMLRAYGSERELPAEVDGKEFVVDIPAVVTVDYGPAEDAPAGPDAPADPDEATLVPRAAEGFVSVIQARSPQLTVPEGVDAARIRDVLVNLPVIPDNVRAQLAGIDDWQRTLPLPVPAGAATEVEVGGTTVVLVSEEVPDPVAPEGLTLTSAIFNDDGVIRGVSGTLDRDEALSLAASLMR